MLFEQKTVLVTGGGSGIGRGLVLAFAEAGADVAFTYLTSDPAPVVAAAEAFGHRVAAIRADLRAEAEADAAVDRVATEFGGLDVVIANSGGMVGRSPAVEMPLALWNETMAVNVTATFLVFRAALRHMLPRASGNLIVISSMAGHTGGGPSGTHYGAAKGAMIAYVRGLAKEVGPSGVRVNGIAPGLIATRFQDTFGTPERRRSAVAATPLRREGRPEDVAGAALFLASPAASFVTGETVEVNGGQATY